MHSLVVPNPNYVCTICSQTFTRRWRGSVHNTNIHAGLSHIVRLIDYIIGRVNGEYKPGDPSWYRRPNKYKNRTDGVDEIIRADKKDLFREMRRKEIRLRLAIEYRRILAHRLMKATLKIVLKANLIWIKLIGLTNESSSWQC